MASADLFADQCYVIDTSSLVDIHQQEEDDPRVWQGIFGLIQVGRLRTVRYAFDELENIATGGRLPDFPLGRLGRLKELKRQFVVQSEELAPIAGRLVYENPSIRDWRQKDNAADPWIIAAGKLYGWRVVTQENDTGRRAKKRIPWVCDQQRPKVKWIRLRDLIENENFFATK